MFEIRLEINILNPDMFHFFSEHFDDIFLIAIAYEIIRNEWEILLVTDAFRRTGGEH